MKKGGAHPLKYAPRNNNINKSCLINSSKHELVEQMLVRTSPPTACVEAVVFYVPDTIYALK